MSNIVRDDSATPSPSALNWGLLLVRVALALPFIYHGAAIAFGAFGGPGLQGFSAFTHMPLLVAALVGYGQFLGGLGILFGVLTRLASLGMVVIMLGAIVLAHLPKGYDVSKGGYEHALALLILAVGLILTGPGAYTALALLRGGGADAPSARTPSPMLR